MLTDEALKWVEDQLAYRELVGELAETAPIPTEALAELLRVYRAVQSGEWVLVPKEPTPKMNIAGADAEFNSRDFANIGRCKVGAAYRAMVAAAPELERA